MKFTLKIALGNEAMQSTADIATALHEVADKLMHDLSHFGRPDGDTGNIRDVNGNTVGKWSLK